MEPTLVTLLHRVSFLQTRGALYHNLSNRHAHGSYQKNLRAVSVEAAGHPLLVDHLTLLMEWGSSRLEIGVVMQALHQTLASFLGLTHNFQFMVV
jgi:hypothetical protein